MALLLALVALAMGVLGVAVSRVRPLGVLAKYCKAKTGGQVMRKVLGAVAVAVRFLTGPLLAVLEGLVALPEHFFDTLVVAVALPARAVPVGEAVDSLV